MRRYFTQAIAVLAAIIFNQSTTIAQETAQPYVKTFDGIGKYRTWSIGINAGALSPKVFIGGHYDYSNRETNLGYGLFVKKQFSSFFGLKSNVLFGEISGNNVDAIAANGNQGFTSYSTKVGYGLDLRAEVNVATISFLRRENSLGFNLSAGYGILAYAPTYIDDNNVEIDLQSGSGKKYRHNGIVPFGAGVKFKVSNRLNFNVDYSFYFMKKDDLDGDATSTPESKDKFSYASVGLEFNLGNNTKPILLWSNPIANMYDELSNQTLKQELESLKQRTRTSEDGVSDLTKDSDGDGVADAFDKCPNTPAGVVVDGGGCEIKLPEGKRK